MATSKRTPDQADQAKTAAPAPDTTTHIVLSVPVRHNGEMYGVGADIELTDADAERLGSLVAPKAPKAAAAEGDTGASSDGTQQPT